MVCILSHNRKQFVSLNYHNSNLAHVQCQVPGAILGLLLFFVYIYDLNVVIKYSEVYHLADDTNHLNLNRWKVH